MRLPRVSPSPLTKVSPAKPIRGAANGVIKLIAPNLGDFSMGVSTPSAPVLAPLSSVQYPVSVSSANGGSGTVSLSVANLPAGVTVSLPQTPVPLDTPVTMTVTSTGSELPGTFAVQLSGQLNGGTSHTTNFPVSTQVNTFQVNSVTGGAIVHNNGQEVQVTHTVPQGNAPNFTTCDTPDPSVTCRIISTAPGTVTLGITAGNGASHGTRVLRLNGGRATVHAAMADFGPGGFEFELPSIEVQAGRYAAAYASLPTEDCYIDGPCGYAVLESSVGWIQAFEEADQIEIFVNPPIDAAPGSYSYSVVLCTGSFLLENDATCLQETGEVQVDAVLVPPAATISLNGTDVTNSTQNVVVGQRIELQAYVANLPPGLFVVNRAWAIDGSKVAGYTVSQTSAGCGSSGCANSFVDSQQSADHVVFYWIAGGTNNVYYSATLSDGSIYSATARFSVYRPTATFTGAVTSQPPSIHNCQQLPTLLQLCFGYPENGQNGIAFNFSVSSSAAGDVGLIQTIDTTRTWVMADGTGTFSIKTNGVPTGDNKDEGFFFQNNGEVTTLPVTPGLPTTSAPSGDTAYTDSPSDSLAFEIQDSISDTFRTYLMYRPTGLSNIWVALRVLPWSWSATATLTPGAVWQSGPADSAPPPQWSHNSDNSPLASVDTTSLPEYKQRAQDLQPVKQ